MLFLLAMFLTPLVAMVPFEAAAPALVVVGFLIMTQVRDIDWDDWSVAIPAVPDDHPHAVHLLDRRPASGPGSSPTWCCSAASGRIREIHPLLWVIAAMFVIYFAIDPVRSCSASADSSAPARCRAGGAVPGPRR